MPRKRELWGGRFDRPRGEEIIAAPSASSWPACAARARVQLTAPVGLAASVPKRTLAPKIQSQNRL
jgi:hypothetical protein